MSTCRARARILMSEHRKFHVVLVGSGYGTGVDMSIAPNAKIEYDVKEVQTIVK